MIPEGTGDGTSWEEASGDLQAMIDESEEGDEVWVAAGLYTPSTLIKDNRATSRSFILKDGVSLYGGFVGNESSPSERERLDDKTYSFANATILDGDDETADEWVRQISPGTTYRWDWQLEGSEVTGTKNNASHLLYCGEEFLSPTTIDGFTIRGGNANVYQAKAAGGGVYALGNVTIQNCRLIENSAYYSPENIYDSNTYGGAVHLNGGRMTGCLISKAYCHSGYGNGYGGGVYGINATIEGCEFEDCVALDGGGGVYLEGGSLRECSFLRCYGSSGGAVYNYGGTVENITVYDCRALVGGGVSNEGQLLNALIANCYADAEDFGDSMGGRGGGLLCRSGDAVNCAVFNCTSFNGGGVCMEGGQLINSTVVNNRARATASPANLYGSTADVYNTIYGDDTDFSNFKSVPEFAGWTPDELKGGEIRLADLSLRKGSQYIDSGDVFKPYHQGVDLAGNVRMSGDYIDRGAYEWQVSTGIENIPDGTGDGLREILSVEYVNAQGMRSHRPFKGVNIVTTVYRDGSRTIKKIMKQQ